VLKRNPTDGGFEDELTGLDPIGFGIERRLVLLSAFVDAQIISGFCCRDLSTYPAGCRPGAYQAYDL
jgi:hypothetical protein